MLLAPLVETVLMVAIVVAQVLRGPDPIPSTPIGILDLLAIILVILLIMATRIDMTVLT